MSWQPKAEEAAKILHRARYVVALTGAGLSVESGIPPFRGPGGLWTKYGEPPLNGFQRFLMDPKKAWEERLHPSGPMRELWETLAKAEPNPGHYGLVELERLGVLRCTITQNVDDLHRRAGSQNLAEIHGNATLVRCLSCVRRMPLEAVDLSELPPRCRECGGLLKSDTVSFGEPIPPDVLQRCQAESARADCMLVVGTSATVYPAAGFPLDVHQRGGTLIEVNPYETELTPYCAVVVRAPAGEALPKIVEALRQLRGS
ncbi:MAG: NAD-dependent deacylase [Candidatus Binatia bacterium]|nr:MAG: NAD-dependent deacylase [Fimbriimonadales bacterium]GIW44212.1 MAG: NAD-dependent deacylase [Candidatus Binatia bacterium]